MLLLLITPMLIAAASIYDDDIDAALMPLDCSMPSRLPDDFAAAAAGTYGITPLPPPPPFHLRHAADAALRVMRGERESAT